MEKKEKQKAIIFDIDNTIAYVDKSVKGFRKAYDWERVLEDKPICTMFNILCLLIDESAEDYKILYSTGRDESARQNTIDWFDKCGLDIESKDLFMKPLGSYEQSTITKNRAYNKISKKYDVVLVVDDDPKVIQMFNYIGVNCLQPAFVDFKIDVNPRLFANMYEDYRLKIQSQENGSYYM